MDRDLAALEHAPEFSYRRLWITLLASAAILTVGSIVVRSYPNSGRQAGYEAVITEGAGWARAEVGAATGTALPACNELYADTDASPGSARYDYDSFVSGCGQAIDELLDRHIPLLPSP